MFFSGKVNHNSCAIQAMLLILLNLEGVVEVDKAGGNKGSERVTTSDGATTAEPPPLSLLVLGKTLMYLWTFASYLPPNVRGGVIGSTEKIRSDHNSHAHRDAFLSDPEDRHMKVSCQSTVYNQQQRLSYSFISLSLQTYVIMCYVGIFM